MKDFSQLLLDWYDVHKRPLPWRENADPYRIWLSEIMLQQTRIEAARGYFHRFFTALPTLEALAAAEEETVLKLWEGLGYYSRARNLHKCARLLVQEYGGAFPHTAAELRKLPGIGDYTAGAIASIAFGQAEPAVDGNVLRVLSRFTRSGESIGETQVKNRFRDELRAIYPAGRCGDFTSALMELGEVICTPGTPECDKCPLAAFCEAHAQGEETLYPVMPEKKPRRMEQRRVLLMICGGKVALRRRPDKGLLAGLWEFPNDTETSPPAEGAPCGEAVHIFSHVEWHMKGYVIPCDTELPGYEWADRNRRSELAIPTAFRFYKEVLEAMEL